MKHNLSDNKIKNAQATPKPYKLYDGDGLYVRVSPKGAKTFRFKYRLHGREHTFTIGQYPKISLKAARARHLEAQAIVQDGHHPLARKRVMNATTFEGIARAWIASRAVKWTGTYKSQVERSLERDVFPKIGSKPIGLVAATDILDLLDATSARRVPPGKKQDRGKAPLALIVQLRQWIGEIQRYGVARGVAERDVAADVRGVFTRLPVRNNPGLTGQHIGEFVRELAAYPMRSKFTSSLTANAIELLMLTFVRTGELRQSTWDEFDLENGLWTIPAQRMKMRREHVVPLSSRAIEILSTLREVSGTSGFVFKNKRDSTKCMSATTINRALEYMGYAGKLSGHGFRTTASTWLHEHDFRPDVIEKQLAHESKNAVAAAYNKAKYLKDRTSMMQTWCDHLATLKEI